MIQELQKLSQAQQSSANALYFNATHPSVYITKFNSYRTSLVCYFSLLFFLYPHVISLIIHPWMKPKINRLKHVLMQFPHQSIVHIVINIDLSLIVLSFLCLLSPQSNFIHYSSINEPSNKQLGICACQSPLMSAHMSEL